VVECNAEINKYHQLTQLTIILTITDQVYWVTGGPPKVTKTTGDILKPHRQCPSTDSIHQQLTHKHISLTLTAAKRPHLGTLCVHLRYVSNSLAQHFNWYVSPFLVSPAGCLITSSANLIPTVSCIYKLSVLTYFIAQCTNGP